MKRSKRGHRKRPLKLPEKLIILPNRDKAFHEKWYPGRSKFNFPHPFRGILAGVPNCGKTLTIMNIVARADPAFKHILVIHCDPENTHEYDDLECDITDEIPSPESFDPEHKTLCIIDDVDMSAKTKQELSNLDRLFGYVSTHKNVSVLMSCQHFFRNMPNNVKHCSNVWILWKCNDRDMMSAIERRLGVNHGDLAKIFNKCMHDPRDSLWVDMTDKTPYPMRKNGTILLKKNK